MLSPDEIPSILIPFVAAVSGGSRGAVETLGGDASSRRYHRVSIEGGRPPSAVVMELPEDAFKSDEAIGGGRPAELPFLNVHRYLQAGGLPVPRIYKVDMGRGLLALEDLGDRTFEGIATRAGAAERRGLYREAIRLIAALQAYCDRSPDPACIAFSRRFDFDLLRWELHHFRQWLLEADRGVRLSDADRSELDRTFDWLAGELAASPPTFVHRDFQSRNLMMVGGEGAEAIRIIDFQDALLGSRAYDLVALLRDSYVELGFAEVEEGVEAFCDAAGIGDRAAFRTLFHRQTLQRKLKDAGRFVFIDRKRGNPSFLRFVPASLRYVRDALIRVPEAAALHEILGRHIPELR